jgi:hypothetical protein
LKAFDDEAYPSVAGVHGQAAPILYEACKYLGGVIPDPIEPSAQELEDFWWQV